jgi:hypothetical protein
MLDNKNQIAAFKILNSSSLVEPDSVTACLSSAAESNALNELLKGLLRDELVYPSSIGQYIAAIRTFNDVLQQAESTAMYFSDSITPFTTPSEILQMKLGWECHAKGTELEPMPPFSLVEGIEDQVIASGLFTALDAVITDPLVNAMEAINQTLLLTLGGEEGGAGETVIPNEQILALATATENMQIQIELVAGAATQVSAMANAIETSTSISRKALQDAVAITLTNNLKEDALMSGAIVQIMPEGVIDALSKEVA